jgi:hypothetical protein
LYPKVSHQLKTTLGSPCLRQRSSAAKQKQTQVSAPTAKPKAAESGTERNEYETKRTQSKPSETKAQTSEQADNPAAKPADKQSESRAARGPELWADTARPRAEAIKGCTPTAVAALPPRGPNRDSCTACTWYRACTDRPNGEPPISTFVVYHFVQFRPAATLVNWAKNAPFSEHQLGLLDV